MSPASDKRGRVAMDGEEPAGEQEPREITFTGGVTLPPIGAGNAARPGGDSLES
jgi:hypothetical protein